MNSGWEMKNSIEEKKTRELRRKREKEFEENWRREKREKVAAVKILELKKGMEEMKKEVVWEVGEELRFEREWLDLIAGPGLEDVVDLTLVEEDWGTRRRRERSSRGRRWK